MRESSLSTPDDINRKEIALSMIAWIEREWVLELERDWLADVIWCRITVCMVQWGTEMFIYDVTYFCNARFLDLWIYGLLDFWIDWFSDLWFIDFLITCFLDFQISRFLELLNCLFIDVLFSAFLVVVNSWFLESLTSHDCVVKVIVIVAPFNVESDRLRHNSQDVNPKASGPVAPTQHWRAPRSRAQFLFG